VRRKTRTLFWWDDGEGEMSLSGYWNVMVDSAEMEWGNNWTRRRPSPGDDDDGGKGEVIMLAACWMAGAMEVVLPGLESAGSPRRGLTAGSVRKDEDDIFALGGK
jgi:hypothetical protein